MLENERSKADKVTVYDEVRREHKLHKQHLSALRAVSDGEIYWIERRLRGKTSEGTEGLCHVNVAYWVDKVGGSRVDGWAYVDTKEMVRAGVHIWMWHSVWQTPEGKLVDVTQNKNLEGRDKLTFCIDKKRNTNIDEGIGYNSIIIVDNEKTLAALNNTLDIEMEVWKAYWTEGSGKYVEELDAIDGQFRWLNGYDNNKAMIEQEFGITFDENGKINARIDGMTYRKAKKVFMGYAISGR